MHVEDVYLEVTRKCNYKCAHCLRGNAQNKSMSVITIFNFFSHVSSIGTLTLGGGEPSLATDVLHNIWDAIIHYDIDVENVFMVTNGKRVSVPLLKCFSKLLSACSDKSASGFAISNDIYHTEQRGFVRKDYEYRDAIDNYNYKPYQVDFIEIPENMIYDHTTESIPSNWYARGRAKDWGKRHEAYLDNLKLNDLENPTSIYGGMYVCHNGDVVGDANMAYNDMKPFIRGTVFEWDTLIDNLKTSTIENYHWCKANCDSWEDCNEWNLMEKAKQQIKQMIG